jgi:DNA-binding transcriptional regulator YdaS (Cro superfamily)
MITCWGSRLAAMKKISSGTLNQKEKRETTNATDAANSSTSAIAGSVMIIELRKCRGISPCVQALR